MSAREFNRHDHDSCITDGLAAAEAYCADHKLQFTPVRRRVLEMLLAEHRALGAYDILERLREEGLGSQPPIAYRALDFLIKHRFAHRIERLNAFVACGHPQAQHNPGFLICRICQKVAEAQADVTGGAIGEVAAASGFRIERAVVEAEGVCPSCQSEARA